MLSKSEQRYFCESRIQDLAQRLATQADLVAFALEDGYPVLSKARESALQRIAEMRGHLDTLESLIQETEGPQ